MPIFISSCFLQELYCKYCNDSLLPFCFLQGLEMNQNSGLPYFELCVICLPVIILILLYSDTYYFHFEKYGLLLLTRNYNIGKRILEIYLKTAMEIVICICTQFVISLGFNIQYFYTHPNRIIQEFIIYFFVIFLLITIEIFISSCIKENLCQIFMNIYVYLSLVISFYVKNIIIGSIFFPGILLNMNQQIGSGRTNTIKQMLIYTVMAFATYCFMLLKSKGKDYF